MAEVLLFHHALGVTAGCHAFANDLRADGHVVHVPDLFEGQTFTDRVEARTFIRAIGHDVLLERARGVAAGLRNELVYAGFSLGVLPAQMLAQTRPGARGALLLHASIPLAEIGRPWPGGVPLQIHVMEADELGSVEAARELAETVEGADLFLYPGDRHLFSDSSVADHDEGAAGLLRQRVLSFLATMRG